MLEGMIRKLLAIIALAFSAVPAAAADRRYSVSDFDRIVVEGPYIVRLTTGAPTTARASGSQAALERVLIDGSGQTLRIRRNRAYWGGNSGAQEGPLTIELTTRQLRSVRLVGPARVEVDKVEGQRVDLIVEGSGQLRAAEIEADNLSIGMLGSGRMILAGTAESLDANLQGTGDLDASALRADNATVTASTVGSVTLGVNRAVTVNALGLGEVDIVGSPACTIRGPNAAQVRCSSNQRQNR